MGWFSVGLYFSYTEWGMTIFGLRFVELPAWATFNFKEYTRTFYIEHSLYGSHESNFDTCSHYL